MAARRLTGLGVALALLAGCAHQQRNEPPPNIGVPAAWQAAGGATPLSSRWWQSFDDPVLTHLVEEALTRNFDLRQAAARVSEARALADVQRGAALPELDAVVAGQRSRSLSPVTGRPYPSNVSQSEFVASYEVDLWGRLDALTAAADASAEATAATRDAVALAVAAAVTSGYIQLRSIDAQLELAHRTLLSRQQSLALIQAGQSAGYRGSLESVQAEAERDATAQTIPQFELAAQRQEHALNVLLARTPGPIERGAALPALDLDVLPAAGVPSELLRRRPDIASAEQQVAAADAQLAAARAQLLPSLHLSAALGNVTSSVLPSNPYSIWSAGGSILAPIFNGGRLRSQVMATASRRDQALIGYERAVITSLAEVETQLTAFAKLREQLAHAQAQRDALDRSLRIAHNRFREGYGSYLDELLAQRNLFAVEQNLLQLQAETLVTEVNVYKALGGGWERSSG